MVLQLLSVFGFVFTVIDMKPFEDALRMIRHSKWWEDHTSHLKRLDTQCMTSLSMHGYQWLHLSVYFFVLFFFP